MSKIAQLLRLKKRGSKFMMMLGNLKVINVFLSFFFSVSKFITLK